MASHYRCSACFAMANSEPRGPSSVQANRWPRPDYCQLLSAAGPFDLMANCFERRAVNRNLLVVDRPRPAPTPNDANTVHAFYFRPAPLLPTSRIIFAALLPTSRTIFVDPCDPIFSSDSADAFRTSKARAELRADSWLVRLWEH